MEGGERIAFQLQDHTNGRTLEESFQLQDHTNGKEVRG